MKPCKRTKKVSNKARNNGINSTISGRVSKNSNTLPRVKKGNAKSIKVVLKPTPNSKFMTIYKTFVDFHNFYNFS